MKIRDLVDTLGRDTVAKACGVRRSTIAQWVYNGLIPDRHLDRVRTLSVEKGVDIRDFEEK